MPLFWVILSVLFVFALIYVFRKRTYPSRPTNFEVLEISPPTQGPGRPGDPWPTQWAQQINGCSEFLKKKDIKKIVFIHGTFAGNDPFDVVTMLTSLLPIKAKRVLNVIKLAYQKNKSHFFKDLGHFSDHYVSLAAEALGITCLNFHWDSANHHYSRLIAFNDLVDRIQNEAGNILFLGHSHGGQVLALLNCARVNDTLQKQMDSLLIDLNLPSLQKRISSLKKQKHYYVTLGTPVRYPFFETKSNEVIHIVNHRFPNPFPPLLQGILFTRHGDYIQRMAVDGSDTPSPISIISQVNGKMDLIFGTGSSMSIWQEKIKSTARIHPAGLNLLVDFKDQSPIPNFMVTLFGHGVYTKSIYLLPLLKLICSKIH